MNSGITEPERNSVCMAAYNGMSFIKKQLDSILAQIGENDEVIIVDDGSKDGTPDFIRQIADPRIKLYVNEKNLGVIKTFGKAIGGDILCGKKSFMLLTALHKADAATLQELKTQLARQDTEPKEKIRAVTAIYDRLNVRKDAEDAIREHTQTAIRELATLPDNTVREQLRNLAEQMANRTK